MTAGWLPDESGLPFERYWDGARWTDAVRPLITTPPPGYPSTTPRPFANSPGQPWYRRKGLVITGAVVSAIIVISAIAGAVAPKKSGPNAADNPAPAFQAPSSERLPNPNHKTPHKAERQVHRASPTTVQLLAASSNIRAGGTVKISGSVSPGLAGHVVYLQRRVAPYVWVSVQHQRLSDRSSFHFAVSGTRAGAFVYRVRQPRVLHQFQAGVSQVVHIRVHAVVHHVAPQPAAPKQQCTPGYSPCVPVAYDVDCAGGSGDGPAYVEGPIYVTGSDPYGLDSDGDGVACES